MIILMEGKYLFLIIIIMNSLIITSSHEGTKKNEESGLDTAKRNMDVWWRVHEILSGLKK